MPRRRPQLFACATDTDRAAHAAPTPALHKSTGFHRADVSQFSGYGTIGGQTHALLLSVPEPSSLAIVAMGGAVALRRRRV